MPTYDYRCLNCKDEFEHFSSINTKSLDKCIKCNGKLKRLPGIGGGIIFKGAGFYCNDYKKDEKK